MCSAYSFVFVFQSYYIGLGGSTQPGHFTKYETFDHIWGAAYTIDQNDLNNYIA